VKDRGRLFITTAVTAVCLAAAMAGGSCAEGDDHPPGQVGDLHYFWTADALVFKFETPAVDQSFNLQHTTFQTAADGV